MSAAVTSPLAFHLHSVRSAFREGYRDSKFRLRSDSPQMRAWHRAAGWAEVRNVYADAVAARVAAGGVPAPSLVEVYRLISARYDCAVERARAAS